MQQLKNGGWGWFSFEGLQKGNDLFLTFDVYFTMCTVTCVYLYFY